MQRLLRGRGCFAYYEVEALHNGGTAMCWMYLDSHCGRVLVEGCNNRKMSSLMLAGGIRPR